MAANSISLLPLCYVHVAGVAERPELRGISGRLTGRAAGKLCGSGRQAVQPSIRSEAGASPLCGTGDIS